MSEKFWIILIGAIAVVLLVLILRGRLKSLNLEGPGVKGGLETHDPKGIDSKESTPDDGSKGVVIRDVQQIGKKHKFGVTRDNVNIEGVKQKGADHEFDIGPDQRDQT